MSAEEVARKWEELKDSLRFDEDLVHEFNKWLIEVGLVEADAEEAFP